MPVSVTTAAIITTTPSPAFYVAMLAYALGSVLFLSTLVTVPAWVQRVARWIVLFAFVAHGIDIGWRGFEQVHPGTSIREALGFLSWIFTGAYLFLARRPGLAILGNLVAPLALILLAAARLSPSGESLIEISSLGRLHIASATIGIGIFSLATMVSLVYLVQERNLKRKKFDSSIYKQGAALETLDKVANRLVVIGFPIFTISMMLGGIWVSQLAHGFFDRIEYPIAAVTWISYGGLVLGRSLYGLRGRRAALVNIVGFFAALLVLGIYLMRRAMS